MYEIDEVLCNKRNQLLSSVMNRIADVFFDLDQDIL